MEGDGRRACAGYSRSGAMIFEGKRIVVTGGTGSMGKTFVHRVLTGERGTPKKVIVFSRDEAKQHSMRMSYLHKHATTDEVIYRNFMNVLEFRIGDVRDFSNVCSAIRDATSSSTQRRSSRFRSASISRRR